MKRRSQGGLLLRRRQSLALWAGLLGVTTLAWIYLTWTAQGMELPMPMAGIQRWSSGDFVAILLMWVVMMIGMMLPSAIPMTLIYTAVARRAGERGHYVAPTATFVTGYLLIWALFSVCATVLQWALDQAALLSPMMISTSPTLGAGLLIAAGGYQWSPSKSACLEHCRS